jgi:ketosteroid isomerase-like protein
MNAAAFASAQEAEAAFYEAFERADLEAMMSVWAKRDDIVCIHPAGPRLVGVGQVRDGWRAIFRAGPHLHFRIGARHTYQCEGLLVSSVQENIQVAGEPAPRHAVLATNVYLLTPEGWLMLSHHASPAASAKRETPAEPSILH